MTLLDVISNLTLATLGVALLMAFVRLVKGPTLPDRIVAMDLFGVLVVGIIVVLAGWSGVRPTLDAAIENMVRKPGLRRPPRSRRPSDGRPSAAHRTAS